jgi:two-component system, chemotaxis family, protein-glutamate methylesterase/glutaminase
MLRQGLTALSPTEPSGSRALKVAPIRVMVVDDSVVVRGLVSRWVEEDPELEAVARHANGKLAVEDVVRSAPDVVVLDIEMPVMDGLTALPLLLAGRPELKVLVVSTLTKRNAEISFKALTLGALDYVPKPGSNHEITTSLEFRSEVIRKIKAVGSAIRRRRPIGNRLNLARRPFSIVAPRIIAIGSSTGGPEALNILLGQLTPVLGRVPVVVTQHMPPIFTTILAERLSGATGHQAKEPTDREPLKRGTIYVAPGNRHMTVEGGDTPCISLNDGPPVNFCKPAVDPLFGSVARSYGAAALGIVLTGMGQDGAKGAREIADLGGSIIAQDESSSVVWGMPGAVVEAGLCAAVLPPAEIGQVAAKLLQGVRP